MTEAILSQNWEMIQRRPEGDSPFCNKYGSKPDELWSWCEFSGFRQNTSGVLLFEATRREIYYPPTFSWYARFTGTRKRDGENFYVTMMIPGEQGKRLDESLVPATMVNALSYFNTFALCECTMKNQCKAHRIE